MKTIIVLCLLSGVFGDVPDAGNPLFVTSLLLNGNIAKAVNEAKVVLPGAENIVSYSGFFTVDNQSNSNLFLWYFPAVNRPADAPVVVWLQGGPGLTTMAGLFTGNGPLIVNNQRDISPREYSWTKDHHMIYIDNPIGTGFSFTSNPLAYSHKPQEYGANIYEAIRQFFIMFPQLQTNAFYIAGSSYGGKFAPALAEIIDQKNRENNIKINLKGLSIESGYCDPINQLNYADYFQQLGLIDNKQQQNVRLNQRQCANQIRAGLYVPALLTYVNMINVQSTWSLFENYTGYKTVFSILVPHQTQDQMNKIIDFVTSPQIRKAIHVGNAKFDVYANEVRTNLFNDILQSMAPTYAKLLAKYRILFYNGQLDLFTPYVFTANFIKRMNFPGRNMYLKADRKIWYDGEDIAGYVTAAANITHVLVRNAGHSVVADQPKWNYQLIYKFYRNQPIV